MFLCCVLSVTLLIITNEAVVMIQLNCELLFCRARFAMERLSISVFFVVFFCWGDQLRNKREPNYEGANEFVRAIHH